MGSTTVHFILINNVTFIIYDVIYLFQCVIKLEKIKNVREWSFEATFVDTC